VAGIMTLGNLLAIITALAAFLAAVVVTALLREEDFEEHWTDIARMDDEAFFLFWLQYNYGGEVLDRLRPLGPWEHISVGVIARRQVHMETIDLAEPVAVVNLDRTPSPVQVPADVWVHAFAQDETSRLPEGTPVSAPKVVFTSAKAGFVLKVPARVLLLLAQAAVPAEEWSLEAIAKLVPSWKVAVAAHRELVAATRDVPEVEMAGVTLEIEKKVIDEITRLLSGGKNLEGLKKWAREAKKPFAKSSVLGGLVEELWTIHVARAGAPVSPEDAQAGDTFAWVREFVRTRPGAIRAVPPLDAYRIRRDTPDIYSNINIDDLNTIFEVNDWMDPPNPRFRRTDRVGEKYAINVRREGWAAHASITWDNVLPKFPDMLGWELPAGIPEVLGPEGEVVAIRQILCTPVDELGKSLPGRAAPVDFAAFAKGVLGVGVELLEWRQGLLLFTAASPNSNATQDKDVPHYLVKVSEFPATVRGYAGGLHAFYDLFTRFGHPLRVFSLAPGECCVEVDQTEVSRICIEAFSGAGSRIKQVASHVLHLRNADLLNINIVVGDMLANAHFAESIPDLVTSSSGAWVFDKVAGKFTPLYSPEQLDMLKSTFVNAATGERKVAPMREFLAAWELATDHPELNTILLKAYQDTHGDEHWDEPPELSEEEQDEEEEMREYASRNYVELTKVSEDADYIYYRTQDGQEIGELKDPTPTEEGEDYYDAWEDDTEDDFEDEEEDWSEIEDEDEER